MTTQTGPATDSPMDTKNEGVAVPGSELAGSRGGRFHGFRSAIARFDRVDPPFLLMLALATVAMYVRMPDLMVTPSLWAEDTDRFIEAFAKSGIASVMQPVHGAGYHMLFERLAATGLALVPLKYAEVLFHLVALLAIYIAVAATWICLPTRSLSARVAACLAIIYVPVDSSTIYLNLVNTQWILAPVTMLLIVTNHIPGSRHKATWCAALAVLCLTGPYAVLATPVILARMVFYRDFRREKLFYFSMLVPVAIQCVALVTHAAARLNIGASDSLRAWYRGIVENTVLQFIPSRALLLLFVVFLAVLLWRLTREKNRELAFVALALLVIAFVNVVAGFYAHRNIPELTGPFRAGERFFFMPFVLLIFFVLLTARGALKPMGLFFVGFACIANAVSIESGPAGRGPNYWKSQIEAARFFEATTILTRPIWIDPRAWKYEVVNPAPEKAPVEKPLGLDRMELVGLTASPGAAGALRLSKADDGRDLLDDSFSKLPDAGVRNPVREAILDGRWHGINVNVVAIAGGAKEVTILAAPQNELFHTFAGVDRGGTVTFAFEARSDAPVTISPHVTDSQAGTSFAAALAPEWRQFVFDFRIKPRAATRARVYLTRHSAAPGTFQVRNVRATLDAQNYVMIRVPDECAAHGDLALTYLAVNASGMHRLDASATKDRFREWNAQHRYAGGIVERKILFAVPNEGLQWLKLSLPPPLEMRDPTLRCF